MFIPHTDDVCPASLNTASYVSHGGRIKWKTHISTSVIRPRTDLVCAEANEVAASFFLNNKLRSSYVGCGWRKKKRVSAS